MKTAVKFIIAFIVIQVATYVFAGAIAFNILGTRYYYPPSPGAISFLRDPLSSYVQHLILPVQILRGLLYALALLPFRKRIIDLGQLSGGLAVTGVLFIIGWLASSGGLIEHSVFFTPIPAHFKIITFIEILLQTSLCGQLLLAWERRYNAA